MGTDDRAPALDTARPEETYYRGTIVRLSPGSETGVVRTASGREILFTFQFVVMVGPRQHFEDLRVGMPVGYDLTQTAKGLRVNVLRIFE